MCSKQPQRKCPLFIWDTSGAKKSMGVRDHQSREQLTSCVSMTQATGDSKIIVNQMWKKKGKKGQKKIKWWKKEGREEERKEKFLWKWIFKFVIQAVFLLFLVYEFLQNLKKKFYISMGVTDKKIQGTLTQTQ